jgi:hypothetical protein
VTTVQVTDRCNGLLELNLDWHIVLIFQEFIFDQENTLIIPRWLLGHDSDHKRPSAERWTN